MSLPFIKRALILEKQNTHHDEDMMNIFLDFYCSKTYEKDQLKVASMGIGIRIIWFKITQYTHTLLILSDK